MLLLYYVLILIETEVNITFTPRQNRREYSSDALIFMRFRKIAKSDYEIRPVCPSVLIELDFYWTDFHEI
jgi:hypothetical protein